MDEEGLFADEMLGIRRMIARGVVFQVNLWQVQLLVLEQVVLIIQIGVPVLEQDTVKISASNALNRDFVDIVLVGDRANLASEEIRPRQYRDVDIVGDLGEVEEVRSMNVPSKNL